MLRMEIALFLVLALVAYMYFSAERKSSPLHRTFSVLLVTALVQLVFDALTIYTVNHLDTAALSERHAAPLLHRHHDPHSVSVLPVHSHPRLGGDRQAPSARPCGEALSLRRRAWRAAPARALRRHPAWELFRRHPRKRLLCQRHGVSAALRGYAAVAVEKDRQQEEIRHRRGAHNRTECVGSSGAAPYMAHQRHGHHADDACLLSHA